MSQGGKIRGIAFDLDGVLVHSTACHRAAFEKVLQPFGIGDFDYSQYAGWRTAEVIAAEFRRCALPLNEETIRVTAESKTLLARQKMAETNPVAADCREVLERLAGDYHLALASSGSRGSVNSFLGVNRLEALFRSVLSGEDVAQAKPDPEIYRKSFAALGLEPHACVVVEDAISGVEAGRNAGAQVIGVSGTCSGEVLLQAGAARVVARLNELPDLIGAL